MERVWKGRGTVLGGVSRESLSEEVTLAGSFKRKMKHMPPLLLLILGSQCTSIYFMVLLSSISLT